MKNNFKLALSFVVGFATYKIAEYLLSVSQLNTNEFGKMLLSALIGGVFGALIFVLTLELFDYYKSAKKKDS